MATTLARVLPGWSLKRERSDGGMGGRMGCLQGVARSVPGCGSTYPENVTLQRALASDQSHFVAVGAVQRSRDAKG